MKKLILATMMLCASTAQAADWSPVFKEWVGGCLYFKHPVAKAVFKASSDYVPLGDYGVEQTHTVLSLEGQMGDYSAVPMPYRQDLLPAVRFYKHGSVVLSDEQVIYVPLRNAKFYNLPLHGIEFYDYTTGWYYALNFGKYSKLKEQQLKKVVKRLGGSKDGLGMVNRTKYNELTWVCEVS